MVMSQQLLQLNVFYGYFLIIHLCWFGYSENVFNHCPGRTLITNLTSFGFIETPNFLTTNTSYHCEWQVQSVPGKSIILEVIYLSTECMYNFVHIYDGCMLKRKHIAALSGENITLPKKHSFIARSGCLYIHYSHNFPILKPKFKLKISTSSCPFHNCAHECVKNVCKTCITGFTGLQCQLQVPNIDKCHDHWSENKLRCIRCPRYYTGYTCSLSIRSPRPNTWHKLWPTNHPGLPSNYSGRLFHASSSSDVNVYLHGGLDINMHLHGDLIKLSLTRNQWVVLDYHVTNRQRKPSPRFGHKMLVFNSNLLLYGGYTSNDETQLSKELWQFSLQRSQWSRFTCLSGLLCPPPLAHHTMTVAGGSIFIIGGLTEWGEPSSEMYHISILGTFFTAQRIQPTIGWTPKMLLFGHTTIWDEESKQFVIYGGLQSRYSVTPSAAMFTYSIKKKVLTALTGNLIRPAYLSGQVFHSSVKMGDFMVVYGGCLTWQAGLPGYANRCLHPGIRFFHLKCYKWFSINDIQRTLRNSGERLKFSGNLGHTAEVIRGNILIIFGGFSGIIHSDVNAYVVPPVVSTNMESSTDTKHQCTIYGRQSQCSADPVCVWCGAVQRCFYWNLINSENCGISSSSPSVSMPQAKCPGLCGRLNTCTSCVLNSEKNWWRNCRWCAPMAACISVSEPCLSSSNSLSAFNMIGNISGCLSNESRSGLFIIRYKPAVNMSFPDVIVHMKSFPKRLQLWPLEDWENGQGVSDSWRLKPTSRGLVVIHGFISSDQNHSCNLVITLSKNINFTVVTIRGETVTPLFPTAHSTRFNRSKLAYNLSFNSHFTFSIWSFYTQHPTTLYFDVHSLKSFNSTIFDKSNNYTSSHRPLNSKFRSRINYACSSAPSCIACLAIVRCVWCSSHSTNKQCMTIDKLHNGRCPSKAGKKVPVLEPGQCSTCRRHLSCAPCAGDSQCEWLVSGSVCLRRGRFSSTDTIINGTGKVVVESFKCPIHCQLVTSCNSCLASFGCSWCLTTETCIPLSRVTAQVLKQCTRWLPPSPANEAALLCAPCSAHKSCSQCLAGGTQQRQCGWCYQLTESSYVGHCVQGDLTGPRISDCQQNNTRTSAVSVRSLSRSTPTQYVYSQCPEVNECALGYASSCLANSECIDTLTGYTCRCKNGYVANDTSSLPHCIRTCYPPCVHGICVSFDNSTSKVCRCHLGWTGPQCNQDCGCFQHSTCTTGVNGLCDLCHNGTTGPRCEHCLSSHFGDSLSKEGCHPCRCNGHGLLNSQGRLCDLSGGRCFCANDTIGDNCERCREGYWGRPAQNESCYQLCEEKLLLSNVKGVGFLGYPRSNTTLQFNTVLTVHSEDIVRLQSRYEVTFGHYIIKIRRSTVNSLVCSTSGIFIYEGLISFSSFMKNLKTNPLAVLCNSFPEAATSNSTDDVLVTTSSNTITMLITKPADSEVRIAYQYIDNITSSIGRNHNSPPKVSLGHTLVRCSDWLFQFGGLANGEGPPVNHLYRILVNDDQGVEWIKIDCLIKDSEPCPPGMAYHAAVCDEKFGMMFILGGEQNNSTNYGLWIFKVSISRWFFHTVKTSARQSLRGRVGHSLSLIREPLSLVLIGGVDRHNLRSRTDSIERIPILGKIILPTVLPWKLELVPIEASGPGPLWMYGQLSVGAAGSEMVYLWGGRRSVDCRHLQQHLEDGEEVMREVLVLDKKRWRWHVVPTTLGRDREVLAPQPRILGSATIIDNNLLVFGGDRAFNDTHLYVYSPVCNSWMKLHTNRTNVSALIPVQGAAMAVWNRVLVITGGLTALGTPGPPLQSFLLPRDLCTLATSPGDCCLRCHNSGTSKGTGLQLNQLKGSNHADLPGCQKSSQLVQCSSYDTCVLCLSARLAPGHPVRCRWISSSRSETGSSLVSGFCQPERDDWSGEGLTSPDQCPVSLQLGTVHCQPTTCPQSDTCQSCLSTSHNSPQCEWWPTLKQCLSVENIQTIFSLHGVGQRISNESQCPDQFCKRELRCSDCLGKFGCGWLSWNSTNGESVGVCSPGGFGGSTKEELDLVDNLRTRWFFVGSCPPENECLLGYDTCSDVEICEDRLVGFVCNCRTGYKRNNIKGICEPICEQTCVYGTCVRPNYCQCQFGYTGAYCQFVCNCNHNSDCAGENALDQCLACRNHSQGRKCAQCEPLYVGNPGKKSPCITCQNFCNRQTEFCGRNKERNWSFSRIKSGPQRSKAWCYNCKNNTEGRRCSKCRPGFYRLSSNLQMPCTKCECRGHADQCNPNTGTDCKCGNHTRTPDECNDKNSHKKGSNCYKKQCSMCFNYFSGDPSDNVQCYRDMAIEKHYCISETQRDCETHPEQYLAPGRAVFFDFKAQYQNVNARLYIEIAKGAVDVYIANTYKLFKVRNDEAAWGHRVILPVTTNVARPISGRRGRREAIISGDQDNFEQWTSDFQYKILRSWARNPAHFTQYKNSSDVLWIRGVRELFVLSIDQGDHLLRKERFYILLHAVDPTWGQLYFSQQQPHVDLFVFFSVFFSCFFLLLALSVLVWKTKLASDRQQARIRERRARRSMASRPFGQALISVDTCIPPVFHPVPLAVEPTRTGQAAVATVVIRLPGPGALSFATALVTSKSLHHSGAGHSRPGPAVAFKNNIRNRFNYSC